MAKKKSSPPAPQPIDYGALMAQAGANAQAQIEAQKKAQIDAYGAMLEQALAAVNRIAGKLNNSYTHRAEAAIDETAADVAGIRSVASQMGKLGDMSLRDIEGTAIERELQRQAERDLFLGRQLSPEQQRDAEQSARIAFSVRGLGMGTPAATAEILNRDAHASAREAARRDFATGTNQLLESNRIGRISTAGTAYGNQGSMLSNAANLGLARAGAYVATDPYQRALNSNLPGQVLQGSVGMAGMASDAYNQSTNTALQVAGFNTNMAGNIYNSWQNNQAALRGAQLQASATGAASKDAMTGQMIGAGGALIGTAAVAIAI